MNKKGQEEYMSVWWILIWAIIGVSISIGVIIFYSTALDVRDIEADILAVRVAECLIDKGYFAFDLSALNKDAILNNCKLSEKILDSKNYFLKISFFNSEGKEAREAIKIGKLEEAYCKLKGENYPVCLERKVYVLNKKDENIERLKISILAGSSQLGKKLG